MKKVSFSLDSVLGSLWQPKVANVVSWPLSPKAMDMAENVMISNTLMSRECWYVVVEVYEYGRRTWVKFLGSDGTQHYRALGEAVYYSNIGFVTTGDTWYERLKREFAEWR